MKHVKLSLLLLICGGIIGCSTVRSISHSEYRSPQAGYAPRPPASDPGFEYRGELSEFDVLGIQRGVIASESDIQQAINNARPVTLRRNSSILLIQSGAMFPD